MVVSEGTVLNWVICSLEMPQVHKFEQKLAAAWPPEDWQDIGVLLAVSGGPDSVSLLRTISALKQTGPGAVEVAHLNHGIRPEQSELDAQFVTQLCKSLSVPCHLGQANVLQEAGGHKNGLEEVARHLRYRFLQETAERIGARYVATAHTANDQAETILHHVLRGTGVSGLAGIPRSRRLGSSVSLIRPMLNFSRSEIIGYLEDLGQPYRVDLTNQDLTYTRNRIRHELLPALAADYNEHVCEALCRLGTLSRETQQIIDSLVDHLWDQCTIQIAAKSVTLDTTHLQTTRPYLTRELFKRIWRQQQWPQQDMGFRQWDLLARMATDERSTTGSTQTLPGCVKAQQRNDQFILTRR